MFDGLRFIVLAWGTLSIPQAWSTVTIKPVHPHTSSTNTFYYAATGGSPQGFMASDFRAYDLTKGHSVSTLSSSDMILLDISSDTDFTVSASNPLILKLTANNDTTNEPFPFPIAAAGPTNGVPAACSATNPYCVNTSSSIQPAAAFWMVQYPKRTTVRVGVYPLDICHYVDWVKNGGSSGSTKANGCSSISQVIASLSAAIEITASIYVATPATVTDDSPAYAAASGSTAETADATLNFQVNAPSYTCPANLNSAFYPSDAAIFVNGPLFATTRASGGAPVTNLVVTAKANGTADSTPAGYLTNDVLGKPGIGGENLVSGFVNTTNGSDNLYDVLFSVQDQSGFIANFDTACHIQNVQTSKIQTFLQTSRCFIATGAFRSDVALPVLILRDFRDQILLNTDLGELFVKAYYHYSPDAGEWLWYHPEFRFPVIAALLPLIIFAWLILNPLAAAVLFVGMGSLFWMRKRRNRS